MSDTIALFGAARFPPHWQEEARMKRRKFIAVLGGATALISGAGTAAQLPAKMLRVGYVTLQPRSEPSWDTRRV